MILGTGGEVYTCICFMMMRTNTRQYRRERKYISGCICFIKAKLYSYSNMCGRGVYTQLEGRRELYKRSIMYLVSGCLTIMEPNPVALCLFSV